MKKKYIIPTLLLTEIHTERLIAESINEYTSGSDGSVLVKGDRSADHSRGSRSDYNVWNDDWSK